MKKKILITLIAILSKLFIQAYFIVMIIAVTNDIQMNESLELRVPKLTKREITELQESDLFNDEEVRKIHLLEIQKKIILNKIKKNKNWKKGKIDERLEERMKFYTREEIFYKIPEIKNSYWIFKNRSNGVYDKHSVDELLEDRMYYAISFGILDVDNNVLYYYEYDK